MNHFPTSVPFRTIVALPILQDTMARTAGCLASLCELPYWPASRHHLKYVQNYVCKSPKRLDIRSLFAPNLFISAKPLGM